MLSLRTYAALLVSAIALGIIYTILKWLSNLLLSPLRSFPGPRWCAASNIPYAWNIARGKDHSFGKRLHEQYGDIVRLSPDKLSFCRAQAWDDIYGPGKGPDRRGFEKDLIEYPAPPSGSPSIFRSNNADHKRLKTVMSRAFSEKALAAQESLLLKHVALLMEKLHHHVPGATANPVDLAQWFNFITFDITGDLGFGGSFNMVENGEYHEWVEGVVTYMKMRTILRVVEYFPFLKGLLLALSPRSLSKRRMEMYRWSTERVKERITMKTERPDFYTPILSQTDKNALSEAELQEAGLVFIIAGSETTSSALAGVMYLLGTHPDVLSRLTAEIRESYKEEKEINVASLSDQRMLNAVLEESLRLFPPGPGNPWRKVPEGGAEICGHFVPENVTVGIHIYSVQRQEDYFPDANSFRPERWLDGDTEEQSRSHAKAVNPFSLGPKGCIGKSLAYAQMRLIVAHFLWNFDLLPIEDLTWMDRCKSYTVWEKPPLMVRYNQRARPPVPRLHDSSMREQCSTVEETQECTE